MLNSLNTSVAVTGAYNKRHILIDNRGGVETVPLHLGACSAADGVLCAHDEGVKFTEGGLCTDSLANDAELEGTDGGGTVDGVLLILYGQLAVVGTMSVAYYIICILYAHIGISWLWIWPLLSLFCFIRVLMLHFNVKVPKAVKLIYRAGVIAALAVFILVEGLIVSAMTAKPEPGLDYIITLGAAVRNGIPTSPLMLRIEKTAEYLSENPDTLVICSGGQGVNEIMSEAQCIKENLVALGIDERRIIIEDKSTDTEQNIKNSFAFIPKGAKVGVVTSSFHIFRAVETGRLMGVELSPIPAKSLLPLGIHYTVREFFAVVKSELKALL